MTGRHHHGWSLPRYNDEGFDWPCSAEEEEEEEENKENPFCVASILYFLLLVVVRILFLFQAKDKDSIVWVQKRRSCRYDCRARWRRRKELSTSAAEKLNQTMSVPLVLLSFLPLLFSSLSTLVTRCRPPYVSLSIDRHYERVWCILFTVSTT